MAAPAESRSLPDASCLACGGDRSLVCDAAELAVQRAEAERFHAARLVRADPAEREERSSFTQSNDAAQLLACHRCRLLARDPMPAPAELVERYAEDAYPAWRLDELRASQVASFRRKLPWLRRLIGRPHRVVDVVEIGSFLGGFLEVARLAGWNATGIDPGRQVGDACRARGLDVRTSSLEAFDAEAPPVRIDCVAIWNTFDQLADPRPALDFARRRLRPGGVLALRVPHGVYYRKMGSRLRGAGRARRRFAEACLVWNNLLGFPYLYGYGLDALDRLIRPHGFDRAAARGDVLCLLAGRATADWARREERACKQMQRMAIRLDRRPALAASPWIDVCYRRRDD
jgi:SAM-dependent methyltransferase